MHIYGDSKVIIDWAKGEQCINLLSMDLWLVRVWGLIDSFNGITFSHIFWEQNQMADDLSKLVLKADEGFIFSERWSGDGQIFPREQLILWSQAC